jgi:gliding motility-associated-like protein
MKVQNVVTALFLFLFTALFTGAYAQSFSGKDFWFGYIENVDDVKTNANPALWEINQFTIDIISKHTVSGTVSIPLDGWSQNFNVVPGVVTTVIVPFNKANHQGVSDAIRQRGVHLVADSSVIAYVGMYRPYSSDAATAIPTSALGNYYEVTGYGDPAQGQSQIIIIGTEDNTTIRLNPAVRTVNNATWGSFYNVIINKGETYQIQAFNGAGIGIPSTPYYDLTGTIVDADKPVAVYTGNLCAIPGGCLYCDNLFEQQRPKSTWGVEYYFAFTNKTSITPDVIRVLGGTNGTNYTYSGINFTLNAGDYRDHDITGGGSLLADQPVMLTQFLRGAQCSAPPALIDPLLLDVLPKAQYANEYLFATSSYARYSGGHFATVLVPTGEEGSLRLNGAAVNPALFNPIAGTAYSYGHLPLSRGTYYEMTSITAAKFGVYVYGYGADESYGYTAGGNLISLNGCPVADFAGFNGCEGDSTTFFDASLDPSYNIVNFDWNFGDGNTLTYATQLTTIKHKYAAPGTYNVTLTITNDAPTACVQQLSKNVTVYPTPTFYAGVDLELCDSDTAFLDGGDAAVTSGTAPFTYLWTANNGSFTDASTLQPGFTSDQPASDLNILITDDNGCEATDDVHIDWNPSDEITLTPSDPVCFGEQPYFTFNSTSLALPVYEITLLDGAANQYTFTGVSDGSIMYLGPLAVTTSFTIQSIVMPVSSGACISFDPEAIEVKVRPLPDLDIDQDDSFCVGSDIELTFTLFGNAGPWNFEYEDNLGNIYNQNNIATSPKLITHSPVGTTTYTAKYVEYAVAPACRQLVSDLVTLTEVPIPTADLTGATTICEGSSTSITITFTGQGPWEIDMLEDGTPVTYTVQPSQNPFVYSISPTIQTEYELLEVRMVNNPFCAATVNQTITIDVSEHFMAGNSNTLDWCAETPINLFDNLNGNPDAGGVWSETTSSGGALNTTTGDYNGSGIVTGVYNFTYTHNNDAPCPIETATIALNLFANPLASLDAPAEICEGDNATLTFNISGTGPFDLDVTENGSPIAPPIAEVNNGFTRIVTPAITTTYNIVSISDNSPAQCQTTLNVDTTIVVNQAPKWEVLDSPCDSLELFYKWELHIYDGDPSTYYVDLLASTVGGTFAETSIGYWVFTSAWIPTGVSATIVIKDAKGCNPIPFVRASKCNCKSDAGDLDVSPQIVCGNDSTWLIETRSSFVGPGDVQQYILCDDVVNAIVVGEHARNATGYFNINSAPGLVTGQQYYAVRVVGDDDGSGDVNMADLCLSISQKVPVIFRPLPTATFTAPAEVCANDSIVLTFNSDLGTPYFDIIYTSPSGNKNVRVDDTLGTFVDMQATGGIYNYDLIEIKDVYGCTSYPNIVNQVTVHDLPTAQFLDDVNGFVCSNNNQVNLAFDLTGKADYEITYTTNGANPTTVSSINIASAARQVFPTVNTDYLITKVKDANGCENTGQNINIVVGSVPTLTLNLTNDTICLGDVAELQGTITGGQPTFYTDATWDTFVGTFSDGNRNVKWYYTPSVVGTYPLVFTNFHDSSPTNCFGTIAPIVLTVVETPEVTLIQPRNICEDDVFTYLPVYFTKGKAPYSVGYAENGVPKNATGLSNIDSIQVNPSVGWSTYEIINVTDANGICTGSGTAIVNVYKYATPTYTVSSDVTICEGQSHEIVITTTGDSTLLIDVVGGVLTSPLTLLPNTDNRFEVGTTVTGTATYQFSNLRYKTNDNCPVVDNKQVTVTETPLATAYFTDDAVICAGESIGLEFHVSEPSKDYLISYLEDNVEKTVTLKDGEILTVSPTESTAYDFKFAQEVTPEGCYAFVSDTVLQVTVNPIPTADLIVPTGICFNDSALVEVRNLTGNGPFDIQLELENEGVRSFFDAADSAFFYHVPQTGIATYWIKTIADNTVSDATGGACVADLSGNKLSTIVNELPLGTLSLLDSNICENVLSFFTVDITAGQAPFEITYTINNLDTITRGPYNSSELSFIDPMPEGTYVFNLIEIKDASTPYGCASDELNSSDQLIVRPLPDIDFIGDNLADCGPMVTEFTNLTDSVYYGNNTWSFGWNKQVSNKWSEITNQFESAGYHDIALMVRTQYGCIGTKVKPDYVQVYPDPLVDFSYNPNPINLSNTSVRFFNETVNGATYKWSIDTVTGGEELQIKEFTEVDPTYKFDDEEPGEYLVLLESWSEHGCYGNFDDVLYIEGELLVNIPNAFTPNDDGTNDFFRPYLFGHGHGGFKFEIYDRWGNRVYKEMKYPQEGQEWPDYGWDGNDKHGVEMPGGIYIYDITVQNKYSKKFENFNGELNLLR